MSELSYTPTHWVNEEDADALNPIQYLDADNLNNIENGIKNATEYQTEVYTYFVSSNAMHVDRVGNLCMFTFVMPSGYGQWTTGYWNQIISDHPFPVLPIGYRPIRSIYFPGSSGKPGSEELKFWIQNDGTVEGYNYSATSTNNVVAHCMYITNDPLPEPE